MPGVRVVLAGSVKDMEVIPIPVPLREINCAAAETFRLLSTNNNAPGIEPGSAGRKARAQEQATFEARRPPPPCAHDVAASKEKLAPPVEIAAEAMLRV